MLTNNLSDIIIPIYCEKRRIMKIKAPWLNFYNDIKPSLSYPDTTICGAVFAAAKKYPDAVALTYMGQDVTYKQMTDRILRLESALVSIGVKKGDRVAVCLPNIPQAVYALYAINRLGAVSGFLHPLSAVGELCHYIKELEASCVITLDSLQHTMSEVFEEIGERKLVVTSAADELRGPQSLVYRIARGNHPKIPESGNVVHYKKLMSQKRAVIPEEDVSSAELAVVLFSGGTTGVPKGVMLSNKSINAMGLQTAEMSHSAVAGKKMLAAMPMFHGFGLGVCVHTALMSGADCILVPRFSVKEYAKLIKKHRPNFIAGVPTLFEALTRNTYLDGTDLCCLEGVFSGGDTLPQELKKKFDGYLKDHGARVKIREGYGATECVTASCLTPYDTEREGSIGLPFPDMFYKICKVGTSDEVPYGEEGEICISGPSVMMGYLNNPKETAEVLKIHSDGRVWLHSGDMGMMDSDGFVYFRHRLKRIIITSGYNVYPSQIERVLDSHESVRFSCVVGVRDAYKMQSVKAYVVLCSGYAPSDALRAELLRHLNRHIARYAIPKEIEFRESLPMTKIGKVAYKALESEANS